MFHINDEMVLFDGGDEITGTNCFGSGENGVFEHVN
jgi:hypothetical protein